MRNEGGGFAEIDDEVATVLAFVISHATFLAAQDDETGRCPKVVLSHQSLETSAWLLIPAFKFQGLVRCFYRMKHCTNLFEPSERIEPTEPANRKLSTINKIFHFRYK